MYLHKILRKTKQTKNEQTKIKLNKSKTRQKKYKKHKRNETKQNKSEKKKKTYPPNAPHFPERFFACSLPVFISKTCLAQFFFVFEILLF